MRQLQFITHQTDKYTYLQSAQFALDGGCRWIQLRMKDTPLPDVEETALQVQELCKKYGATFILDDHVGLTLKLKADGVHLGKKDMPVAEARKFLGKNFLIGGTANTFNDIKQLVREGVNYIGLGPFRFTTTKKNLSPIIGLDGYRRIMQQCADEGIHIPLVAIGGITINDIPALLSAGVPGIALSSTILQAESPIEETKKIIKILSV
ncbi:thiamine phosphate synthase [Parabacteroides pacaensis]|uniref:thiamine phosphate synthase n=1 Tax=Parabacteroides pacaensis TaxID=2086575 RepID=UPI000D10BE22|nr:thiamine phosphate synthase [Parabacteroides pacaensis]